MLHEPLQMTSRVALRRICEDIEGEHEDPRDSPTLIAHIFVNGIKPVPSIFITKRWIVHPLDPATYIRLVNAINTVPEADIIAEIDTNLYVITEYEVGE